MESKERRKLSFREKRHTRGMREIAIGYFILIIALIVLQRNISFDTVEPKLELLPPITSSVTQDTSANVDKTECLIIWENNDIGVLALGEMEDVLDEMRISHNEVEATSFESENLSDYSSIILAVTDSSLMGEGLLDIMDWVEEGGNLMMAYIPDSTGAFAISHGDVGIVSTNGSYVMVEGLHVDESFMLGATRDYMITDPYESSLAVVLSDECEVKMYSVGEKSVPLIWSKELGEGRVVVNNRGDFTKAYRGIYCAAYSLLGEACVYPVINGSTFYIDDFPSPVPSGYGKKIKEDYGMTIDEFYTNVWWKDTYELAEEYGFSYTGLVIEEYSDEVEGPFARNNDIQRYQYFGNMLLRQGGEIGLHGFNHMPLVLPNFTYTDEYEDYKQWVSYDSMKAAFTELNEFCGEVYPESDLAVYVPPSNILSDEGRDMLLQDFPNIKVIASIYLTGELGYSQEFEEADDGLIETPRIISGYILDDYMQLVAFCELNMHYVNTHFQHPDDVLDSERGADLGWEVMHSRLESYTKWLYDSAPQIRNLTGSELAAAVQRYDRVTLSRSIEDDKLILELDNFYDEVWLMVRINEGSIDKVEGGSFTQLGDELYLLQAKDDEVIIQLERR